MRVFIINSSQILLEILKPLFNELYVTISDENFFYLARWTKSSECKLFSLRLPRSRLAKFLLAHIMYLLSFFKTAKRVDVIVVSQMPDYPLIVLFLAKLMRKKLVDFVGGSRIFLSQVVLHSRTTLLRKVSSVYGIISLKIATQIVERVILISNSIINDDFFNKIKNKIRIAQNFPSSKFYDEFRVKKRYSRRSMVVGYVGRFTRAKGVYNFALAIKYISKNLPELNTIFVGDYQNSEPPSLGLKIIEMLKDYRNVTFTGQVGHQKVAEYLNKMRLLVLPSYSEGLPHVILEAMACGTPVLATPVGAIPDIIKEGETGFLLKSNDPKHIAERIVELLNKPELLEKVSINAYNYVRENFSYKKTLERWKSIINEL